MDNTYSISEVAEKLDLSDKTLRGSRTIAARYWGSLYQFGGSPSTGHG